MQTVEQVRDALRVMALAADRAALDHRSDDDNHQERAGRES